MLLAAYLCIHTLPCALGKLNTDFPNYYMSARLMREGYDPARMYEWIWLQREKDHRGIDVRIIGLLPITPFSTLAMWPLAGLPPLSAKRVWIAVNLVLLVPLVWIFVAMTGLSWQRVALAFALSFPLHRDLLYGQYYIVLLLMIAAACWAYVREKPVLAGALVAVATACKLFPVVFLIFFLRRRAWRALLSAAATGIACMVASVEAFGWNVHSTYLHEVLPWTLHGEALPPYATMSNSISSVLHYLFLKEPQWNPHPWHDSPLWYALLLPTIQMAAIAPAILLIRQSDRTQQRVSLEWSALLTASLAVSTSPASYNFVLLALPLCVVAAILLTGRRYGWLAVSLAVYAGIGFPMSTPAAYVGPIILFYVPRLLLTLALLLGIYTLLWSDRASHEPWWNWRRFASTATMAGCVVLSVVSTLRRENNVRQEYAYRLHLATQDFIEANPTSNGEGLRYIEFSPTGYNLVRPDRKELAVDPPHDDDLSYAASGGAWVERATDPDSQIVEAQDFAHVVAIGAREPMVSADGQTLALIRDQRGFGRLVAIEAFRSPQRTETFLSPPSLNTYEASFISPHEYAFSAAEDGRSPTVYLTDGTHSNAPIGLGESRYPALSPDRRWLVFSHLEEGAWNLWLRDEASGALRRIADVPCNQIQPSWEKDSRTVLYATDCGRSLWFTAVARRQIIP